MLEWGRQVGYMEVIPAIDLMGGKCVRLYQGDYSQETVFSEDPVEVALQLQTMGAHRLHLVDLDGAAAGKPCNLGVIEQIVSAVWIPVQLGGGIRQLETAKQLLGMGVERVILGTIAVEAPGLVEEAARQLGEAIIVGVDVRDGHVAVRGWQKGTSISTLELVNKMTALGVGRIIYTDINRDGTLTEPNFVAITELVSRVKVPIIASGGISSIGQLRVLSRLGVEAVIVGKALYTGDIDLKRALKEEEGW